MAYGSLSELYILAGLDSTSAMHLLQLLRQLATSGRCIVTTIHQPSSRLFQQLDKLLLLSQVLPRAQCTACHKSCTSQSVICWQLFMA